jgi:TonB-linked SusC/RagA family outer membrane protein
MKIFLIISCYFLIAYCKADEGNFVIQKPLQGYVINKNGERIEGATVRLNGEKSQIYVTGKDGEFRFPYSSINDTLVVVHIAYKSYRNILIEENSNNILVELESNSILIEEVTFSTGYEKLPRERATGSFERIDSSYINRVPSPNILTRIKSVVSGIYADGSRANFNDIGKNPNESLNLHGISSLSGTNTPLIILDDFPYQGNINSLNPNDVEDITFLKDAAATSIWGAQAGNGVIVITTKKGKQNTSIKIDALQTSTVMSKPDLFARNIIANRDLVDLQTTLYDKGFYASKINSRSRPSLPMSVEVLEKRRKGILTDNDAKLLLTSYGENDIRYDMLNYLYRNAMHQQYALSFSGGSSRNSFHISSGYDKSEATQVTEENSRFTLRANNKLYLGPKFNVEIDLLWSRNNSIGSSFIDYYTNSGHQHSYLNLRGENGENLAIPQTYSIGYLEGLDDEGLLDWLYRPLDEIQLNKQQTISNNLLFSTSIHYKLNKYLDFNLRYRNELVHLSNEHNFDQNSIKSRNLINLYTTKNSDGLLNRALPIGGILEFGNNNQLGHMGRMQMNLKWNDFEGHEFYALMGFEMSERKNLGKSDIVYGYNKDKLIYSTQIDYYNRYPTYDNLSSTAFIPGLLNITNTNHRFISTFANASYTFKKRYTWSGSMRRDASNVFGMKTNDKWNPLWSTGLSWNLSNEPFFQSEAINLLKLRTTYGYSGTIDPSRSANTTLYYSNINTIYGINWPSAQILIAPNPSLRWEKIQNLNFGLDITLLNNKLSGTFDMYWKNSLDLIHTFPLDPTVGLISQAMNVANAYSKGFDVRLTSLNIERSIKWKTDFIFTYNNNWIKKTHVDYPGANSVMSSSLIAYEGAMPFGLYSYRFAGLEPNTGIPMGYVDGEVSTDYNRLTGRQAVLDELVLHGSSRPLYFGILNNFISYKNMVLSLSLGYKLGYFLRRPSINYTDLYNSGNGHNDYYKRWQKPGDEEQTNVPAMTYPLNRADAFYTNSEVLVEPGDHIKLNDIRFQYAFNMKKSSSIKNLTLHFYVNQLGILWKKTDKNFNPEYGSNIPIPTQYTFGINIRL